MCLGKQCLTLRSTPIFLAIRLISYEANQSSLHQTNNIRLFNQTAVRSHDAVVRSLTGVCSTGHFTVAPNEWKAE